jgi:hypothetical protein
MGAEQRKALIEEIQVKRGDSRLICYVTSDRPNATAILAKDVVPLFYNHLMQWGKIEKLDILLFTTGGDTLAAFHLGQLTREFAGKVAVLVPDKCFSAGTLFALGANEIYMTGAGTLSPIDPSIVTPLNPVADGPMPGQKQLLPVSVESVAGFKSLMMEEWGIKSEDAASQIYKLLAERVHPLALGDVYRSRQQIERLANQLLSAHRKDKTNVTKIIQTLTRELGSHDYPISRKESRKLLGHQIAADDNDLEKLVWRLFQDYRTELLLGVPYNPAAELAKGVAKGMPQPIRTKLQMAVVESVGSRDAFEQEALLSELVVTGPAGPVKALQQAVLDAGWKHYEW